METISILLAGLLALGILVRQFAGAAKGQGCASCAETCACLGQKSKDEQNVSAGK